MSDKTTQNTSAVDPSTGAIPKVKWDDSSMQTSYSNVCNVAGTREEVALLFGTNQTGINPQGEVTVNLSNRIIVSPYAAKRLALMLSNAVKQYEERFGELAINRAAD